MRKFWFVPGLAMALAVLAAPEARTQDWRDALADLTRDLPDLETQRIQRIARIYEARIFEAAEQGSTEAEQIERAAAFVNSSATWMASCALLYSINVEAEVGVGWMQQRSAESTSRHLGAFAVAVSGIYSDVDAEDFADLVLEARIAADEALLAGWIEYKSTHGEVHADHERTTDFCNDRVMRPINDIEIELGL